jgi:hypothetical protein
MANFKEVLVRARSSQPGAQVKLMLATKDAVAYSAPLPLSTEVQEVRIPLSAFQPDALLIVPRPYPAFLPLRYQSGSKAPLKLADAEVLQVVWEAAAVGGSPQSVDIESISLQ